VPGFVDFLALLMAPAGMVAQACPQASRVRDLYVRNWGQAVSARIGTSLLAYSVYGLTDLVSVGDRLGYSSGACWGC